MSQRVYLIPVKSDLVSTYNELVLTESPERAEQLWQRIRRRAEPHRRAERASRHLTYSLSQRKFTEAERESDYYAYDCMRPYLLTGDQPDSAAIQRLHACKDEAEVEKVFQAQLQSITAFLDTPDESFQSADVMKEEEQGWANVRKKIETLKAYRQCFLDRKPVDIEVLRRISDDDDEITMWNMDETETLIIAPEDIPEEYGHSLGNAFAHIAAASEPTWWLGNNLWLGLCAGIKIGVAAGLFTSWRLRKLQQVIRQQAKSPAPLFSKAGLPGYEKGFDLSCPAYSTGLYFPYSAVTALLQTMKSEKQLTDWLILMAQATGYPPDDLDWSMRMILEAFHWAASMKCGLLEGDEFGGRA